MTPSSGECVTVSNRGASRLLQLLDSTAVLLSGLCLLHCLALPLLVAGLPWALAAFVSRESFHLWMLLAVVPSSLLALALGCRRHRDRRVIALGLLGVLLLAVAAVGAYGGWLGDARDTQLTVIGAILLAGAHLGNWRLHRH